MSLVHHLKRALLSQQQRRIINPTTQMLIQDVSLILLLYLLTLTFQVSFLSETWEDAEKCCKSVQQQHVNVGVWSPWVKQHRCEDVHCLSLQLPVSIRCLSFFLFGHISSLIRTHKYTKTRRMGSYYSYLCWSFCSHSSLSRKTHMWRCICRFARMALCFKQEMKLVFKKKKLWRFYFYLPLIPPL